MILLDTNILIDLLEPRSTWAQWSRDAVIEASMRHALATSVVVLAECARHFPSADRQLDFLEAVGITPRALEPSAAFRAGRAHRAYRKAGGAREAILADFLIGGHAIDLGAALLTRDRQRFAAYFPDLTLIAPETHPMADAPVPYRIHGSTGEWEVVIGLEVHAQVTSNAKLFSGAATAFGAEPNSQVSLVDAAMPGMLPVPNRECIRQAVRTGMAVDAAINKWSRFDRKNYFYADLPQGYQISQLYHPLVGEGHLDVVPDEKDPDTTKRIGIERIHVEQDAGKLMHDQHPTRSYVDLNRSGVALMEIVSRPDMASPAEAGAYLTRLRSILRYVGSCDGNMDQGSMRADVNVSVRKPGDALGTRTETKNVNSIRFVMQVIEFEAKRQVEVIEGGGTVDQETRLFNPDTGRTRMTRSKEDAQDYRYFPDPDLLPLELDDAFLAECRASLPELPDAKRARYEAAGVTPYNAGVLTAEVETARWFDALLEAGAAAGPASNWVTGELFGALNRLGKGIADSPVTPARAAELLALVADGTLSGSLAKQVFEAMLDTGDAPTAIVEARGLKQTSDTGAIEAVIAEVLAKNPGQLDQYRGGKTALFGFFVGQTMKAMGGKANPGVVNDLLRKALG